MNIQLNTRLFALPALCLGGAALLLAPVRSTEAFTTIAGTLNVGQRDVRVFDNFGDATANDNVVSPAQFPGWTGVELAVWKGVVEWGSMLHGDGTGDGVAGNPLGSGGANFDAFWAGSASGVGTTDQNVVSTIASCSGSTLAFTETPISDGWRIRFCENITWDDGPANIGGRFDIQGVMCHEYGHALGLGHSSVGSATMFPSVGAGQTGIRSIAADDIAGVQSKYGVADAAKPTIVATQAVGSTLNIYGTNYGATGNEIWFTNNAVTLASLDPIVRVAGVASSGGGTLIAVTIPAGAKAGDVIVRKTPGTTGTILSNAFPTDLLGTFGTPPASHPNITNVTPSTIDALIPGTAKTVTLSGSNLDLTTDVELDGSPIAASRYTIVNPTTITLDMPQTSTLGLHDLGVTDGVLTDTFPVTIDVPITPQYELGNGNALNVVDRTNGLSFRVSGQVGSIHRVFASLSSVQGPRSFADLSLGASTNLFVGSRQFSFVIPAAGWVQLDWLTADVVDPGPGGLNIFSQTWVSSDGSGVAEAGLPLRRTSAVSNLQSIHLVQ